MLSEVRSRISLLISTFLEDNAILGSDVTCSILCNRLFDSLHHEKSFRHIYLSASEAHGYLWEAIHSKSWEDVDAGYRDALGLITLIAATAYHHENLPSDGHIVHESQLTALIDSGILLGSGRYHAELILLVEEVHKLKIASAARNCMKGSEISVRPDYIAKENNRKTLPSFLTREWVTSERCTVINRKAAPSLVRFYNECLLVGNPAVLTGCMEDWTALERWRSLDYYIKGSASGVEVLLCSCRLPLQFL